MDTSDLRKNIKIGIISLFMIIVIFVLIRMALIFIGANDANAFMEFWRGTVTDPFVTIFNGVYPNWKLGRFTVETASLLSIFSFIILALLTAKLVSSFVDSDPKKIFIRFIDSIFKFLEIILIFRFFLRLTGAQGEASFTTFLYNLSFIVYEPFVGILPSFNFGPQDQYLFETSTLIAIIIIIIFDILQEGLMGRMLKEKEYSYDEKYRNPYEQPSQESNPYNIGTQQALQPQQSQPQAQPNTININVNSNPNDPNPFANQQQQSQTQQAGNVGVDDRRPKQIQNPQGQQDNYNPYAIGQQGGDTN